MHISLSVYFAAITVGYVKTAVNVSESDGVAQLTVCISVPLGADPIETLFFLLVNTLDETATATGLSYWSSHTLTLSPLNRIMTVCCLKIQH